MATTAVILAAGRGSRLDPGGNTLEFSKPLMKVGGQTLLERTVSCCRAGGARRIVIVSGFRAELVAAEAHRIDRGDLTVVFNEDWQKSNGLSLYSCRHEVEDDFALMMSDHIFDPSILADLMALAVPPASVTLAVDRKVEQVFDLDDATKVRIDEAGRIAAISKQLEHYNAIDCGLFLCTQRIFAALAEAMAGRGDCSLSEGMALIGRQGKFLPFDIGGRWWQDVDTPEMLANAQSLLHGERIPAPEQPARAAS